LNVKKPKSYSYHSAKVVYQLYNSDVTIPVPDVAEATARLRFITTVFHRQELFKNRQQYLGRSATCGACNDELYRRQLDVAADTTVL
jgi:hypothetical protein